MFLHGSHSIAMVATHASAINLLIVTYVSGVHNNTRIQSKRSLPYRSDRYAKGRLIKTRIKGMRVRV